MARPKKSGLEYFPFDIDMFEDEKVLPVSVEFGAKGEAVVVRVLCAIYREGYFVRWSEGLKFKIANQVKLSEGLVSGVVSKLVKYHFFNEDFFNQHQVLTSAGLQKRWKEATRKRVNPDEKEFWLLNENKVSGGRNKVSGGRNTEETPLKRPESTQSKVKESKGNKEPPISPPKGDDVGDTSWKKDFKVYLKELRSAYRKLIEDSEFIRTQEKFHPNVDIKLSLEKACTNFWATEAGWIHKKKKRSKIINWKSTLTNAIDMNKVYKSKENDVTVKKEFYKRPDKW